MATRGVDALDDKGYVVYTRKSNNTRLEKTRKDQEDIIRSYYASLGEKPSLDQYRQVGNFLVDLGKAEERKEKKLIESVLGIKLTSKDDVKKFIDSFNQVLVGTKQYEDAVKRIGIALKEGEKAGLAPTISSLYVSKLNKILGRKVNDFIHKELDKAKTPEDIDKAIQNMEEKIIDVFEECFDEAFEDLLSYQNKNHTDDRFGTGSGYQELLDLFHSNKIFQEIYKQKIRKSFNDESIKNIIKNNEKAIRANKRMYGHTWVKKALSFTNERTGQIGGSVNEIVNMLRSSIEDGEISESGYKRDARTIESNKVATDNIVLFQFKAEVNEEIINEELTKLSKKLDGTENMAQAHKELMEYWDKYLSKINEGFVVFQSAKAYRLTNIDKFKGFTNTKVSLDRLYTLPRYGSFKNVDINKLVKIIANTMDDTILSGDYSNIREWLYTYICESIAFLLFDDWEKVGDKYNKSGANSIHALLLDDINVPMSVFLKGAGNSLIEVADELEDSSKFINIIVHKAKILFPTTAEYYADEHKDIWVENVSKSEANRLRRPLVPNMPMAWNKQRNDTLRNYTITVKFYKNFNEEILSKIIPNGK